MRIIYIYINTYARRTFFFSYSLRAARTLRSSGTYVRFIVNSATPVRATIISSEHTRPRSTSNFGLRRREYGTIRSLLSSYISYGIV